MLHGTLVRSTIAHGRLTAIDTRAARAIAGVHRVVTGADIPELAPETVRYAGEPVAVVLAADPRIAEAAAQTVAVASEPLPAIVDEIDALGARAIVHDATLRLGNVEGAFAAAEHVVAHGFRTRVRQRTPVDHRSGLAAALSRLVGQPVELAATEPEDGATTHAVTIRLESAVTTEGRILARRGTVAWNGGADDDVGAPVAQTSGRMAAGPYDIDDLRIDTTVLRTNLAPGGAVRGDGIPPLAWACENHTDLLARGLGLDPFDFRRRNLARDAPLAPVLDALESRMDWRMRFVRGSGAIRRGRGVAFVVTPSGPIGGSGAEVEVDLETGQVLVTRLITLTRVGGRLGCALLESRTVDAAQLADAALAADAIDALHELPDEAVGVRETGAVAPAIANAIHDAAGVRLTALPLTSEAVYRGLRAAIGAPLPAAI